MPAACKPACKLRFLRRCHLSSLRAQIRPSVRERREDVFSLLRVWVFLGLGALVPGRQEAASTRCFVLSWPDQFSSSVRLLSLTVAFVVRVRPQGLSSGPDVRNSRCKDRGTAVSRPRISAPLTSQSCKRCSLFLLLLKHWEVIMVRHPRPSSPPEKNRSRCARTERLRLVALTASPLAAGPFFSTMARPKKRKVSQL